MSAVRRRQEGEEAVKRKPEKRRDGRVPILQSIQTKYALTYILVVAAILLILNTYPVLKAQDMVFTSKESSLKRQALTIGSAIAVSETLTTESVDQAMALLEDLQVTRVLVTDAAARILYDSSTLDNRSGDYALMGEVLSALEGNDVFRSEYREGAFRSRSAVPMVYRGVTLGAVYLYEYDTDQAELMLSIQSNLRYISVMICAVAVILVVVLAKALTRNTSLLLGAIRRVREGEYSHRVEPRGHDEMTQLADEFNQLTDRLQTTEEVRRRFVSDASHELKTPLASIRLLTDSILQNPDVDPATVRDFMEDIGEETDRLTRISERLLTLTRLDAAPEREVTEVDLCAVVEKVAHMLRPLAQEGQVTLECHLERGCTLLCTEDDLYQVAFNLMENAIKYNLPGGRVDVTACRRADRTVLEVSDTGVGIPEEDRPKIFDRFYRVDKARSRAAGGTGLGLAIVRETVKLHGGTITVAPGEGGKGTRFTAEFPAHDGRNGV